MDFLGIGPLEMVTIIVIALLVLGPQKMVDTARSMGKLWREVQKGWRETVDTLTVEEPRPQRVELPPAPPPEGQRPYEAEGRPAAPGTPEAGQAPSPKGSE